jgi:N-acetylated-alpha-linked acidic dipeptidase
MLVSKDYYCIIVCDPDLGMYPDISVAGSRFNAAASPLLAHLIRQTALRVPHPSTPGKSMWDARNDEGPFEGPSDPGFAAAQHGRDALETGVYPLGSGSDFTVFLQRLGARNLFRLCIL